MNEKLKAKADKLYDELDRYNFSEHPKTKFIEGFTAGIQAQKEVQGKTKEFKQLLVEAETGEDVKELIESVSALINFIHEFKILHGLPMTRAESALKKWKKNHE